MLVKNVMAEYTGGGFTLVWGDLYGGFGFFGELDPVSGGFVSVLDTGVRDADFDTINNIDYIESHEADLDGTDTSILVIPICNWLLEHQPTGNYDTIDIQHYRDVYIRSHSLINY